MKKTVIYILFILLLHSSAWARPVGEANDQTYSRIIFAIDCSNSMNYQDQSRVTDYLISQIMNMADGSKTEIGYVMFNDQIVGQKAPSLIAEEALRADMLSDIAAVNRQGSTDIGLALRKAVQMLEESNQAEAFNRIVLLSDGETDLNSTRTGRTLEDSRKDEEEALAIAEELGCRIITVGIDRDGNLNTGYLQEIADRTGGSQHGISGSEEAPALYTELMSALFAAPSGQEYELNTAGQQNLVLEVPAYTHEINLAVRHNRPIQKITAEGAELTLHSEIGITNVKIQNPAAGPLELGIESEEGQDVSLEVLYYTDLYPQLIQPEGLNQPEVKIRAGLYSGDGQAVTDETYYGELSAQCLVYNTETGEEESLPMEYEQGEFSLLYQNADGKPREISVRIEAEQYRRKSESLTVEFGNTPPTYTPLSVMLLNGGDESIYIISDYFSDADGDELGYEIVTQNAEVTEIEMNGGAMRVQPKASGTDAVLLRAVDGRGAVTEAELIFEVAPFWIYYRNQIVGIGCIFIILLAAYLFYLSRNKKVVREKPTAVVQQETEPTGPGFYNARFEGYFYNTMSGKEVPVLNWNAFYIDNKKRVSLGELFAMMDVEEHLPEAYKIFFEPGNNGTVVFHHRTKCLISIAQKDIPEGRREILNYDDKLMIVFEDNVTEIEIRYKRVRRTALA